MVTNIRFGTDGWRALIADEFTFANVARCTRGLCDYIKEQPKADQGLIVGYDTRFLSPEFGDTVAGVCASQGIKVRLCKAAAPTPVASYNVLHHQAAGAVIITSSHNPAQWNGFKFKPDYAGSATQTITDRLEEAIKKIDPAETEKAQENTSGWVKEGRASGLIVDLDPDPPYLERIASLVDLDLIRGAGLNVVVDAMYGAGLGYLPRLLAGGKTKVEELHGYRNPAFPDMDQPEPITQNLGELLARVPQAGASVGIALDGDADRVGIVDEHGHFITTLNTFNLLAYYLMEEKGLRGDVVKGVTSSMMLNKMEDRFGIKVHEMKVGFKNIGPKMRTVDALMAGEESGGFAFKGHIPERDGVLSGLYLLEYMATTKKSPSLLLAELFGIMGPHHYHRLDLEFDRADRERIQERVDNPDLNRVGEFEVLESDTIDGRRLKFKDGWLATRFSGTEPLLRIYAETDSPDKVTRILDAARKYLGA